MVAHIGYKLDPSILNFTVLKCDFGAHFIIQSFQPVLHIKLSSVARFILQKAKQLATSAKMVDLDDFTQNRSSLNVNLCENYFRFSLYSLYSK